MLAGAHLQNFPGKQLAVAGQKEPEVEQDMYMHHPSPFCNEFIFAAMRSAHERAAYLRQRPVAAVIQRQAAKRYKSTMPSEDEAVVREFCASARGHKGGRERAAAHLMQQQQQL